MQRYYVDLRSYDEAERDRLLESINRSAWDVYPQLDHPGILLVMWDMDEPISECFGIPERFVRKHLPQDS